MKQLIFIIPLLFLVFCGQQHKTKMETAAVSSSDGGQSTVEDDVSQRNVVQVAISSTDHTTLVTALKKAEYVDVLSNAGPFTVFAPTNAAFDKLPAGTVEDLLKPENKAKLQNILEYHVFVGVLGENMIQDGMAVNQVNLKNITINKKDGKITVNGVNVLGSVKASNGLIYIIDGVLLPPEN